MKGWVYVISNKSMPGLIKVGYSTKDPDLRAQQLNGTGVPHPFLVDYEALVEDPYQIEQTTHVALAARSEAKEWFRCSAEEAIAVIRQTAGQRVFHETFKRAERAKADELYLRKQHEADNLRKKQEAERDTQLRLEMERQQQLREEEERRKRETQIDSRLMAEEQAIRDEFEPRMKALEPASLSGVIIISVIAVGIMMALHPAAIALPIGLTLSKWFFDSQNYESSNAYRALEVELQNKLSAVRFPVNSCGKCSRVHSFDRKAILLDPTSVYHCRSCNAPLAPPPV